MTPLYMYISVGSNGANAGTPPVFFQGRLATPVSLIQHRHITYVSSTKKQPSIDAIEEDGDDGRMAREGGGNASGKAMPSRRLRTSSSLSSDSNSFSQTNSSNNNSKRFNSSGTFGGNNAAVAVEVAEEVEVVQLSETHTEIVFSLNSFIAASDTRAVVQVEERNARYTYLIITSVTLLLV